VLTLAAADASWSLAPGPLVLLGSLAAWYVVRWRQVGERPVHLVLFLSGILVAGAALMSPIDPLGEQLFLMHMVQHLLLLDIVALLLILGLTRKILRPVTRRMLPVEQSADILATPTFAITLYVATMWFWHIPALYDLALENDFVHVTEHLSFAVAGGLYWWHLFSPIRPRHRLMGLGPAAYMVVTKILVGLLGVFLTFAPDSFYAFYESQPRVWGLSPGEDQAIGGAIMALEQMIVMGAAFGWLFVRMLSESNREDRRAERYPAPPAPVPRVRVELHPDQRSVALTKDISREGLRRQAVILSEGMPLVLVTDLGAERPAVARYDPEWGGYFAELTA
jgi:putative membrane protein